MNSVESSPTGAALPSLEPIAMVALDAGRMLMEAGASAAKVEDAVDMVARGLGADRVDLRAGYASLAITIGVGDSGITRMRNVGKLGVNQQLSQHVWDLARRVSRGELTTEQTRTLLDRIAKETPHHGAWVIALAVGIACAAFARLLDIDWRGVGPVFVASTVGQLVRRLLLMRHVNIFICTMIVSSLASVLAGLSARWAGSHALATAMIASVLMLVPGVPAVNAQTDILEGHPTLGSARVVSVVMTLIFLAAGLWVGRVVVKP